MAYENLLSQIAQGVDFNPLGHAVKGYDRGRKYAEENRVRNALQEAGRLAQTNPEAAMESLYSNGLFDHANALADKLRMQKLTASTIAENASQASARKAQIEQGYIREVGDELIDIRDGSVKYKAKDPYDEGLLSAYGQPPAAPAAEEGVDPSITNPAPPNFVPTASDFSGSKGDLQSPLRLDRGVATGVNPLQPAATGPRKINPFEALPKDVLAKAVTLRRMNLKKESQKLITDYLTGKGKGRRITMDDNGDFVLEEGSDGLAKPTVNLVEKEQYGDRMLMDSVNRIDETYNREYLTTMGELKAKGYKWMEKGFNAKLNDKQKAHLAGYTKFRQNVERAFNDYRNQITGAAAAVAELSRLKESFLNSDMSPTEFESALQEYQGKLRRAMRIRSTMLKERSLDPKGKEGGIAFDREFNKTAAETYADIQKRNPHLNGDQIEDMLIQEGY